MRLIPRLLTPLVVSLTSVAVPALHAADADHGKQIFQQSCAICHATGQDSHPTAGQGPLLAGVVGRPSAALTDFGYSKALHAANLKWTTENLNRFLAAPPAM